MTFLFYKLLAIFSFFFHLEQIPGYEMEFTGTEGKGENRDDFKKIGKTILEFFQVFSNAACANKELLLDGKCF